MKCALCGNEELFSDISQMDAKSSQHLSVSMCNTCGLVQQNPIPTADELRVYYSHNYRKDYKNTFTPKSKHVYRAGKTAIQRISFLNKANISNGTLLDVGAGGGEFVYLAQHLGYQSQGAEPNVGYSEYANDEYGCNVITGELNELTGKYDIITIFHVLEHLPSPIRAFEKLHQLLNNQGVLFVEVPWIETNDASPSNIFFKAHIFYFSAEALVSCASQFFDVVTIDTSSNLKVIFKARAEQAKLSLPGSEAVERLTKRLDSKGWFEYLFKGKGFIKPFRKLAQGIDESKVKGISPKKILDEFILEKKC